MIHVDFATGFNLPPYWLNHPQVVKRFDKEDIPNINEAGRDVALSSYKKSLMNIPHACPLQMGTAEATLWQLPIEPVVSISGKNVIVRRNVLKQNDRTHFKRGTIKELWSQDDYEITIAGLFIEEDGSLPKRDLMRLRELCEFRGPIHVASDMFRIFNITKMVIENYELPFTQGLENQMFTIRGYSDDIEFNDLLIKE